VVPNWFPVVLFFHTVGSPSCCSARDINYPGSDTFLLQKLFKTSSYRLPFKACCFNILTQLKSCYQLSNKCEIYQTQVHYSHWQMLKVKRYFYSCGALPCWKIDIYQMNQSPCKTLQVKCLDYKIPATVFQISMKIKF